MMLEDDKINLLQSALIVKERKNARDIAQLVIEELRNKPAYSEILDFVGETDLIDTRKVVAVDVAVGRGFHDLASIMSQVSRFGPQYSEVNDLVYYTIVKNQYDMFDKHVRDRLIQKGLIWEWNIFFKRCLGKGNNYRLKFTDKKRVIRKWVLNFQAPLDVPNLMTGANFLHQFILNNESELLRIAIQEATPRNNLLESLVQQRLPFTDENGYRCNRRETPLDTFKHTFDMKVVEALLYTQNRMMGKTLFQLAQDNELGYFAMYEGIDCQKEQEIEDAIRAIKDAIKKLDRRYRSYLEFQRNQDVQHKDVEEMMSKHYVEQQKNVAEQWRTGKIRKFSDLSAEERKKYEENECAIEDMMRLHWEWQQKMFRQQQQKQWRDQKKEIDDPEYDQVSIDPNQKKRKIVIYK